MKKHKFKKGDGVLSTNTTREQRAEILKYAQENGYQVHEGTWNEEGGFLNPNDETICFYGECFIGCGDSYVKNPMTYAEIMTKINPEWLLGKKCRGFHFKSTDSLPYSDNMNEYVGKVGEIKYVRDEVFKLKFEDDFWIYPLSEVYKHLVLEEESKPYIPEKYEEVLFWDDDEAYAVERKFLCYDEKESDYPYVTRFNNDFTVYKNCKPLPKEEPKQEKFLWQIQDIDGDWILHNHYITENEIKECFREAVDYRKVESVEQLLKIK